MHLIAPSILAANWSNLEREVRDVSRSGADFLHLDVMDGNFVPVITFGPQMVKAVSEVTSVPLDVHLMIANPEKHIEAFSESGAAIITFHLEATDHAHYLVNRLHDLGVKAGIAINPGTPVSLVEPLIDDIDLLLIMTVNPGWGGQKFIPRTLKKIEQAHRMIESSGREICLEVDGGINDETAPQVVAAGANLLVSGSYVFGSSDRASRIANLRKEH